MLQKTQGDSAVEQTFRSFGRKAASMRNGARIEWFIVEDLKNPKFHASRQYLGINKTCADIEERMGPPARDDPRGPECCGSILKAGARIDLIAHPLPAIEKAAHDGVCISPVLHERTTHGARSIFLSSDEQFFGQIRQRRAFDVSAEFCPSGAWGDRIRGVSEKPTETPHGALHAPFFGRIRTVQSEVAFARLSSDGWIGDDIANIIGNLIGFADEVT